MLNSSKQRCSLVSTGNDTKRGGNIRACAVGGGGGGGRLYVNSIPCLKKLLNRSLYGAVEQRTS